MSTLDRFFGGNPLWVLMRLVLVSVIVGVILVGIGLTPFDLINEVVRLFGAIWDLGFEAIEDLGRYFVVGAVIVVPIWLVSRLARLGRRGGDLPRREP